MLIHNALILPMNNRNEVMENGAVMIKGDAISAVGSSSTLLERFPEEVRLDAEGKVLMPGFINAHMHLYSTFARGIALKGAPPEGFKQILERLWWRLDKALDEQAVRLSAMIPLIQAIRSGTTTIIDHHSSPCAIEGSLDILADCFEKAGLRGVLCYEVSDRDGKEKSKQGINENIRFIKRCRNRTYPLVSGMFGLHASFTLSEETLERCVEAARELEVGLHVHCAEGAADLEHARVHYQKTVVERFADAGVLGRQTLAAHCVHVNTSDMDILAETGTNVVHNPRSNMNNAVGCAPVPEMTERGILVGLGTDGMSARMMDELKVAALLHKHERGDPGAFFEGGFALLFKNNPRIAGKIIGEQIGVIEQGAKADLVILDYDPPTPMTSNNLIAHIQYGLADAPVDTTIVGGKLLMRRGKLQQLDERRLAAKAREAAKKVWYRI